MGPWGGALVADGVGPGVRGLLFHSGLVTREHRVGGGCTLQCCLVHLQAEELASSRLTLDSIFQCDPFDKFSSWGGVGVAWSLGEVE